MLNRKKYCSLSPHPPQWIHFSGTSLSFLGQDIASHPVIPHHLCPFCRLVRAPSKMRLTFSQMRLAFFQMQGAFPPTASRIFENARRIFSDSPCFAILANWICIWHLAIGKADEYHHIFSWNNVVFSWELYNFAVERLRNCLCLVLGANFVLA